MNDIPHMKLQVHAGVSIQNAEGLGASQEGAPPSAATGAVHFLGSLAPGCIKEFVSV